MSKAKDEAAEIESSKKVELMLDEAALNAKSLDEAKPVKGSFRIPHLDSKAGDSSFCDVCRWLNKLISDGMTVTLRPLAKEADGRQHCMLAYNARNACIDVWLKGKQYDEISVW